MARGVQLMEPHCQSHVRRHSVLAAAGGDEWSDSLKDNEEITEEAVGGKDTKVEEQKKIRGDDDDNENGQKIVDPDTVVEFLKDNDDLESQEEDTNPKMDEEEETSSGVKEVVDLENQENSDKEELELEDKVDAEIDELVEEAGIRTDEYDVDVETSMKPIVQEHPVEEDPPIDPEEEWYYADMERKEYQLAELLQCAVYARTAEEVRENYGDLRISGIQSECDMVQQGDLFICDEYEEDAEDLMFAALQKGAVAFAYKSRDVDTEDILEQTSLEEPRIAFADAREAMARLGCAYYGNPSASMTVVGVTGSSGKTSVAWLIRSIFEKHGMPTGIICDIEYAIYDNYLNLDGNIWKTDEVDVAKTRDSATPYHIAPYTGRYNVERTIPDPLQVQKLLAGMVTRGARACVIECPSWYLGQAELAYVEFTLAVFTNLYTEHEENDHPSFEDYKESKGLLFQSLDDPSTQRAIISLDNEHAEEFVNFASKVPVVTYSKFSGSDVYSVSVQYTMWDTEIVIHTPIGRMRAVTGLVGELNVENVLAAVTAAISINIPLDAILEGLESVEGIPGRMEILDEGQQPAFSVMVDVADTPKRLERLLENARNCGVGRILLVVGCKGCEREELRQEIMKIAHFRSHMVFITNDNPKYEHPKAILDDMIAALPENITEQFSLWVFSPFQDPCRVPWWFEEYLYSAQNKTRRFVVEDRSLAIRTAIGTAQGNDIVIIAGRGNEDFQQFPDESGENLLTGWLDDRIEARDALKKLPYLDKTKINRKEVPWKEK